jgi:hypothetical protein
MDKNDCDGPRIEKGKKYCCEGTLFSYTYSISCYKIKNKKEIITMTVLMNKKRIKGINTQKYFAKRMSCKLCELLHNEHQEQE